MVLDAPVGVAHLGLDVFDLVDQVQQRLEFAVAAAGRAQVVDKARRVGQVPGLAVTQRQARKNACHFQVALQAHPFHGAVELAKVITPAAGAGGTHQTGLARLFPVAHGDA